MAIMARVEIYDDENGKKFSETVITPIASDVDYAEFKTTYAFAFKVRINNEDLEKQ